MHSLTIECALRTTNSATKWLSDTGKQSIAFRGHLIGMLQSGGPCVARHLQTHQHTPRNGDAASDFSQYALLLMQVLLTMMPGSHMWLITASEVSEERAGPLEMKKISR